MPEDQIEQTAHEIESSIKIALLKRNMSQVELSQLIGENPSQVNRAIKGGIAPKDKNIRLKIARVLDL